MRYSLRAVLLLLILTGFAAQMANVSVGAVEASSGIVISRTLYLEPSYQVYVDDVTLPSSSGFNITFQTFAPACLFSANAYGPENQTLGVTILNSNTSLPIISVDTAGATSFRLVTILDEMTFNIGNYSAFVNFFPIVGTECTATTTIYLPAGAGLISYSDTALSNTTGTSGWVLSGNKDVLPTNTSFGSITYSGSYSLIEAESFDRFMEITPSSISVQDTLLVKNIDILGSSSYTTITLNLPANASGLQVKDSIGYLTFVQGQTNVTVTLRNSLTSGQSVQFTLVYSLPTSGAIVSNNGRNVLTSPVLPGWLGLPVRNATLTILLPLEASDPQMQGAQITTLQYHTAVVANYTLLTQFTNQSFSLSYVPSLIGPYLADIIIIIIVVVIVVVYIIYIKKWKKKTPQAEKATPAPAEKKPQPK